MRPSQTILVLDDLRNSFVGPLHRKGVELHADDGQTVLDVYQQWLLLMIDLGYLHHDTLKRTSQRLFTDMVKADVLELNNAFAELLHLVRCKSNKGFKVLCASISPHLFPLIREDVGHMMQGDVYSAKRLIQLFSYTGRLSLNKIDLTQQCLEEYLEIEEKLNDQYLPSTLLSSLNRIIQGWLKAFDPTRIHFQHGPGGVAGHGRTSLAVKYKDLTYDDRLTYAFGDPWWSVGPVRSTLDRISSTVFVPKSYKTFRTISMEPSTLQYTQQGVWREIERVVSGSAFLRNRIGFREQARNQRLAQIGSINRNYATLDLSAASDSVSYAIVKKLFRGTKLLRFLVATRSTHTLLPDGRLIALKKFAPMGSALCFPIETIIFAAICQYVTREHGVSGDYSVFGDDIIVPTQTAEDVMYVLETLGFSVNRSKSFYDPNTWFRESCGGEYCDGFDVTPVRVSRKYNNKVQLVRLSGLIDLANSAYDYGFRHLRHFFIRKLRQSGYRILFSPVALRGDNYTNYHAKKRWNPNYQRYEVRASMPQAKFVPNQDESIALRHWLESCHHRIKCEFGFTSRVGRSTVLLKDRWLSGPEEMSDQHYLLAWDSDRINCHPI